MSLTGKYHHGDLRRALVEAAAQLLREEGIDGLSLRKLAERVGVSRMAPYHHFHDKHELLCALAAEGFRQLAAIIEEAKLAPGADLERGVRQLVRRYLRFATDHPEQYELMFGRTIWKTAAPTTELKEVAYRSFKRYAERIDQLAARAGSRRTARSLRLAQASWATLHGLCRLLIDGIYVDRKDMEAVSDEAVRMLLAGL